MSRLKSFFFAFLVCAILLPTAFMNAAPRLALALPEGRMHDQAHNSGYIDWTGNVQYVYLTHKDGTSLPPEEGSVSCGSGCTEWVTRIGNGASASGSFDRDVSYFEAMVGFTGDGGVGTATLRACGAVISWYLYNTGGSLPGFVSMPVSVPAGCRTWSLSASGGYVDFRAVEVGYIGPPSTPTITRTSTATFTPTFTPTKTATATSTFTPTATYTNTPSPTPTPLPPQITGLVVCDLWGDAGWCRGDETLELSASDPQGFDVTISGDLNGIPFTCGSVCSLPLSEGIGTANYQVTSTSGRTASGSSTWQRDATPPDLEVILPPLDGRNGWYVSEVDILASASDAISGLLSLSASIEEGASWSPLPIHFADGVHPVMVHAKDVAGNEVMESKVIRVDTVPPIAQITSHSNGGVVQGEVRLAGTLEDKTSGPAGGEISLDDGATWKAMSLGAEDDWSYLWHSNEAPNGEYTLQMRGMDHAGNVGEPASITMVVDNGPPAVSITERWWIWESGQLKVSPNHFPIANIQVTIRDPQNRWPALVMNVDPKKTSSFVKWDRHFADGTLAPSGEYPVLAEACDVNGLCGRDSGRIVIPAMGTLTATPTFSPTATSTLTPTVTSIATQIPPTPTSVLITPMPEEAPETVRPSFPLWQILGLVGLFMVITSASVVDPRPKALDRLSEAFRVMSAQARDDSFDNKQN